MDRSGDEQVSKLELITSINRGERSCSISQLMGIPAHNSQEDSTRGLFMSVFHKLDSDGSGSVSLQEFISYFENNDTAFNIPFERRECQRFF